MAAVVAAAYNLIQDRRGIVRECELLDTCRLPLCPISEMREGYWMFVMHDLECS
jgi:hypothetical protein